MLPSPDLQTCPPPWAIWRRLPNSTTRAADAAATRWKVCCWWPLPAWSAGPRTGSVWPSGGKSNSAGSGASCLSSMASPLTTPSTGCSRCWMGRPSRRASSSGCSHCARAWLASPWPSTARACAVRARKGHGDDSLGVGLPHRASGPTFAQTRTDIKTRATKSWPYQRGWISGGHFIVSAKDKRTTSLRGLCSTTRCVVCTMDSGRSRQAKE